MFIFFIFISKNLHSSIQSLSSVQSCLTLCNPMGCSTPGFPVLHQLPGACSNSCSSQWCHPTISSSVIPFSSCLQPFPASESLPMKSVLHIRWPNNWSFSFSISPSNEYSGLVSFRIDCILTYLLSKGLSRVFSSTTVLKHQFFST